MSTGCIAIVPARLKSERLPRKPLANLGGEPLIVRVCQNLDRSGVFDRTVVACDDYDIHAVVRNAGFEAIMTDPALMSGTDRVAAAAEKLNLPDHALIINVQGDEPFVSKATLQAIANRLSLSKGKIITPVERITSEKILLDRNAVKAVMGANEQALYFSRGSVPYVRDPNPDRPMAWHFRHIGVYGYSFGMLKLISSLPPHPLEELEKLEQLRWLANGVDIVCPAVDPSPRGVDTPQDLQEANFHYASLNTTLKDESEGK